MSSIHSGARATILTLVFVSSAACAADDADDSATSVAQTSSDTSGPTASSTESSTTTPAESSTTDNPDDTSASSDAGTETVETSGDPSADSSGGSDTTDSGAAGLEIVGAWTDGFGGEHVVTDDAWTTTFAPDVFAYTIDAYDNAERFIIAQDDGDATWSKYEWTYVEADLYYCQSTFGEATADDAIAAPDADPSDPANSGCGGFGWSPLTPAG